MTNCYLFDSMICQIAGERGSEYISVIIQFNSDLISIKCLCWAWINHWPLILRFFLVCVKSLPDKLLASCNDKKKAKWKLSTRNGALSGTVQFLTGHFIDTYLTSYQ